MRRIRTVATVARSATAVRPHDPHNMKFLRSLALTALTILSLSTGALAFVPTAVHAQDAGLNAVGNNLGLSAEDPRRIAANDSAISPARRKGFGDGVKVIFEG